MTTCKYRTTLPGEYSWSEKKEFSCNRSADDSGFCPLHNPDPNKPTASFKETLNDAYNIAKENDIEVINLAGTVFPREITRLPLEHQGEKFLTLDIRKASFPGKADFHDFLWKGDIRAQGLKVIDDLNFGKAVIGGDASFSEAAIGGYANFYKAAIGGDANFYQIMIGGDADFSHSAIEGNASFYKTAIGGYADFSHSAIEGDADIYEVVIEGDATFKYTKIIGKADFSKTAIGGDAQFYETAIGEDADFFKAVIGGYADFSKTAIGGNAKFYESTIDGYAKFYETAIGEDADFSHSAIGGNANFKKAAIGRNASFSEAKIEGNVEFSSAAIRGDAIFFKATIGEDADFSHSAIGGNALFDEAAIGGDASFDEAAIGGDAIFFKAAIERGASLCGLLTFGTLKMSGIKVEGSIEFQDINAGSFHCKAPKSRISLLNSRFEQCDISSSGGENIRLSCCSPELKLPDGNDSLWENRKKVFVGFKNTLDQKGDALSIEHLMKTSWQAYFQEEPKLSKDSDKAEKQFLEYFPLFFLLTHPRDQETLILISSLLQKKIDLYSSLSDKAKSKNSGNREWDFSNRDLSGLSFVKCVLNKADFRSSDIDTAYFDTCEWGGGDKEISKLYCHDELIEQYKSEKTIEKKTEVDKLKKVYQRFKKYFEENHDYRQAGDFHFREMEIRRYTDESFWDRRVLWLYRWIAGYGENYFRVLLTLLLFLFIWPLLFMSYAGFYSEKSQSLNLKPIWLGPWKVNSDYLSWVKDKFFEKYESIFSYHASAVLPKSVGNAFGFSTDKVKAQADPTTMDGLLSLLLIKSPDLTDKAVLLFSMITFYAIFFTLIALFVMSVRRRYRR